MRISYCLMETIRIIEPLALNPKSRQRSWRQILAAAISGSSFTITGYVLGFSSVLIPQLQDKSSDIVVNETEASWIAAVWALAAPAGALLSGVMIERWGRNQALKLSMITASIGWLLIALANNVSCIIIGRLLSGLTCVLVSNCSTVYITEIAEKNLRSSLTTFGTAYVAFGLMMVYLTGWFLRWRVMAWLSLFYTLIPFLLFFVIPESPSWLNAKERHAEANKALHWLGRQGENAILTQETRKSGGNFREFCKPIVWKPLIILIGIFLLQQFSGVSILLSYSVTFIEAAGTTINPYMVSVLLGLARLVISIALLWLLKFFSKRTLLMVSGFLMGVSMLLSGLFTHWLKTETTSLTWAPVVFIFLYGISSMLGVLLLPTSMTAELFPLKIRSLGHSVVNSMAYLCCFLATQNFFNLQNICGGIVGIQWFFATLSFVGVCFTYLFVPDTRNKELWEIEEYFQNNTFYPARRRYKNREAVNKQEVIDLIKQRQCTNS